MLQSPSYAKQAEEDLEMLSGDCGTSGGTFGHQLLIRRISESLNDFHDRRSADTRSMSCEAAADASEEHRTPLGAWNQRE